MQSRNKHEQEKIDFWLFFIGAFKRTIARTYRSKFILKGIHRAMKEKRKLKVLGTPDNQVCPKFWRCPKGVRLMSELKFCDFGKYKECPLWQPK
jgi:hypothetical protein